MSPELPHQALEEQAVSLAQRAQEAMLSLRTKIGRGAAAGLLVAGGSLGFAAIEDVAQPPAAYADTQNYPYANAPCEYGGGHNPSGNVSCANPNVPNNGDPYNWFESSSGQFSGNDCGGINGTPSSECFDPWGYEYDNCTSFVAWQLTNLGVSASAVRGLGNGGDWYKNAPASEQSLTPAYGEAAVQLPSASHPFGHVAFVESVNSVDSTNLDNDSITVYEYNYHGDGNGDTRTGVASAMGFTRFVNFGVVSSPVTQSNPTAGPSIAMNQATGLATAVAEGPSNSLYAYWQNTVNGQWSGPLGIDGGAAGIAFSAPAVAINPTTGLATAVAEGPSNSLYAYWQNSVNGQWTGPLGIDNGAPGVTYSAPSIAFNPTTGLATAVAEGPNGSLYAYWQNSVNGSWSGPLGIDGGASGIAYSAPSVTMNASTGLATAVAEGPNNSLYAYWQNSVNGQWSGPLGIDNGSGGIAYSAPSIDMNQATGLATAVIEGPNNSLYAFWQNSVNGQWSGPLGIDNGAGGIAYSAPSIAMNQTTETATAVAVGPSNSLRAYWQNGVDGQWTGPLGIDGGNANIAYSGPTAAINGSTGLVTVTAEGPDNSLYAYWQNSVNGQWAGPLGIDGGQSGVAY